MKELNNIWKFLQRQLKSKEQKALQEWKDNSNENLALYNEIDQIWSESDHLDDIQLFDAEEGWVEIEDQIIEKKRVVIRPIGWISIAASLILVVGALFWFTREEPTVEPLYETFTAVEQNEELILADSSVVQLEQGSSIRYFTRLDQSLVERRVYLTGKATFDISTNDSLAFVTEVGKTGVKVLGTIFNVEMKDSNDIALENIEGLIKFYELDNEENAVVVEEGESFVYDGQGFVDKTQRPEVVVPVPEPEVKITTKNYTIQQLWYDLLDRFGNKIIINSYGSKHQDATIRITLDQPLNNIIRSLENNPNVLIEYTKTCPDCFEIETLKFLH